MANPTQVQAVGSQGTTATTLGVTVSHPATDNLMVCALHVTGQSAHITGVTITDNGSDTGWTISSSLQATSQSDFLIAYRRATSYDSTHLTTVTWSWTNAGNPCGVEFNEWSTGSAWSGVATLDPGWPQSYVSTSTVTLALADGDLPASIQAGELVIAANVTNGTVVTGFGWTSSNTSNMPNPTGTSPTGSPYPHLNCASAITSLIGTAAVEASWTGARAAALWVLAFYDSAALVATDNWVFGASGDLTDTDAFASTDAWTFGATATLVAPSFMTATDHWSFGSEADLSGIAASLSATDNWLFRSTATLTDLVPLVATDHWSFGSSASLIGASMSATDHWVMGSTAGFSAAPLFATDNWTFGATGQLTTALLSATDNWTFGGYAQLSTGASMNATDSWKMGITATLKTGWMSATDHWYFHAVAPELSLYVFMVASDEWVFGTDQGNTYLGFVVVAPQPFPVKFIPPTSQDRPRFLPDTRDQKFGLMRHYQPYKRGINVFQLSDGTFRLDTPVTDETQMTQPAAWFSNDPIGPYEPSPAPDFPELSNTNIPYPWLYNDPAKPFTETTEFDQSVVDSFIEPYIIQTFYGGHIYEVSQTEALELTAAGLGDCLA